MTKISVCKKAGFCFGVRRAIDIAEQNVAKHNKIYSLGPLIHNPQEVNRLIKKGIRVVNDIKNISGAGLILRTHGITLELWEKLKKKDIQVIDATCPFVKHAQDIIKKQSKKDSFIVIAGEKTHPEVKALKSYGGNNCVVVGSIADVKKIGKIKEVSVVSQTTQTPENFKKIVKEIKKLSGRVEVFDTICRATVDRQQAARELARKVDVIIVVGGKNSGNTNRLADICSEKTRTYHIETAKELKNSWFSKCATVGITAGASTPDWVIQLVKKRIEQIIKNNYNRTLC